MPRFRYVAMDSKGSENEGVIDAESQSQAISMIRSQGYFPTQVVELGAGGRANRIRLLVTQNVDGLHERSEFPTDRLINIHGTDSRVQCMGCGREEPRQVGQELFEAGQLVPRCECGGPFKPATISFGQSLVAEDLQRCFGEAARCDFFVAVGSSLVVSPVNQMFGEAKAAGARAAILTSSETPFDDAADWKLSDPVEVILPLLRDGVIAK